MIEPTVPNDSTDSTLDKLLLKKDTVSSLDAPLLVSDMIVPIYPNEVQNKEEAPKTLFGPRMLGLDKLASVKSVLVRQKYGLLPNLTGCVRRNKYSVYGLSDSDIIEKQSKIFKCKEKANICAKQFCGPQCRGFKMDMNHRDYLDKDFDKETFLYFSRPFKCTMCCFGRPEVEVEWNEGGRRIILGRIKDPQSFCHIKMEVYDAVGAVRYMIQGSGLQCGVICEAECCTHVKLIIKNSSDIEVGSLSRINSFSKGFCVTATDFKITFPLVSTPEDRALLTAATIMLDYMYFEKRFEGLCPTNCLCVCL